MRHSSFGLCLQSTYSGAEKVSAPFAYPHIKSRLTRNLPTSSNSFFSTTMPPKNRTFLGEIHTNRGFSAQLTSSQVAAILSALAKGKGPTQIHRETGVSLTTIKRKRKEWLTKGRLTPKPRSSRPKYFNNRSLRQLKLYILRDSHSSYNNIRKDLNLNAYNNTIRAALKSIYVNHWLATRQIPLLEEDEKLRYH